MQLEVSIMPTLLDNHLIALYSQHSIQSQDLLNIRALAEADGMTENIDDYRFENFLGLTIHLLLTTQSQYTREQLSRQLPKFGSAAVLPLIKILCRLHSQSDLQFLAQKTLDKMALYPLIIGLGGVLDLEADTDVRAIAIQMLIQLTQEQDQSVLTLLPKLISPKTWQLLKLHLLAQFPYPTFNRTDAGNSFCLQIDVVSDQDRQRPLQTRTSWHDKIRLM